MSKKHKVIVDDNNIGMSILRRTPYNLLIYPSLNIWYSRSKKSITFMSGTKIEHLEELVKFDSFIKGKLLESIRSFENMFLGSFAYHFEMEYKKVFDQMSSTMQTKVGKHNVGTKMVDNEVQLIPMWEQFFEDASLITINDEIDLWNKLSTEKFLKINSQIEGKYLDKINSKRFSQSEIKFIKRKFSTQRVRQQIREDLISFCDKSASVWNSQIGSDNFSSMMDIIRIFRNSSSHPGFILDKKVPLDYNSSIFPHDSKALNDNIIYLKNFIYILPYFVSGETVELFRYEVKKGYCI
ncbi:hypothetical protein AB3363_10555 (plasmid) [Leuconostoc mesenteroides]|uniref:hypothetical protein n=1 Tax=Leuconostoc mesenteroides TaxID=1245 RepID=UPI003523EBC3